MCGRRNAEDEKRYHTARNGGISTYGEEANCEMRMLDPRLGGKQAAISYNCNEGNNRQQLKNQNETDNNCNQTT